MSYILTALKKSQQERELGTVPTLESAVAPPPQSGRRWPWMLGGLVAINLAVFGGLAWYAGPSLLAKQGGLAALTGGDSPEASPATVESESAAPDVAVAAMQSDSSLQTAAVTATQPETPAPQAAPEAAAPAAASEPQSPSEPAAPAETADLAVAPQDLPIQPSTNLTLTPAAMTAPPVPIEPALEPEASATAFKAPEPEAEPPAVAAPQQPTKAVFNVPPIPKPKPEIAARTPKAVPERPEPVEAAAKLPEPPRSETAGTGTTQQAALPAEPEEVFVELPTFREMSREFRRSFPKLQVSLHMYHDVAENSFVRINKRKYRAGDKLDDGPRLEEIRENGIVLSYRGETFLLRN